MTRRIAGTFFALLTALLVLAVVPLGITKSESQQDSFRFDTDSAARIVASDAEEVLSDHHSDDSIQEGLATAVGAGDCAAVYGTDGRILDATPCKRASGTDARALVARVRAGERAADPNADLTAQDGQWLLVGVPVGDDGQTSGYVVYARNGDPMDDRIDAMWGWLLLTSVGCLALAGFLSVRLARWVSRPLGSLGDAAARLGEGELAVRAATDDGPEQVRKLAETFNWMAERIETLVHGHRRWIADVSHQLRTPLTALRLRLDLLGAEALGDEHAAAELLGAQDEITRLSRLVDGLLAVARAESAVPRRIPVRADAVARERVAAWTPVAAEKSVELEIQAEDSVTVPLGAGDLEQILDNLIANAIEAVEEGGRVRLEVAPHPRAAGGSGSGGVGGSSSSSSESGESGGGASSATTSSAIPVTRASTGSGSPSSASSGNPSSSGRGNSSSAESARSFATSSTTSTISSPHSVASTSSASSPSSPRAVLRVVDDGPGMSDERKAAAFHRYAHPEPRGNGLGLAIVHRLATANGGRAALRDTPGGGLTVELDWPLAPPAPPPPAAPPS